VDSWLDGGIGLGVGVGLFWPAMQGWWVRPALAMRWVRRRWIFEAGWAEDRAGHGWQLVLARWAVDA
jgi:hypothetical protein